MSQPPRILHSDEVFRLASWQNVVIADVAGQMDVIRVKRIGRAHRDLMGIYPSGTVTCAVLRENAPVADRETREEAAEVLKKLGDGHRRVAVVTEDHGLEAQVVRTVVRGLNIAMRSSKLTLFEELEGAVDAIEPLVVPARKGASVRKDLLAAILAVRIDYRARHAPPSAPR